jgi:hypothetical protein
MLTFANPAFLWGLLGLAAPLLIHLINRDLFRPILFPSIRFILRGKMPVERKRRLRDLLLLALRMLLFAAIIGALARPEWKPQVAAAAAQDEQEIVILIDASSSMSGWAAWDEARETVERILRDNREVSVGLVVSAAEPLVTLPPTRDHGEIRRALGGAEPQLVAGDHRESFRQASRLFSPEADRTLTVITDLQATDWNASALPRLPADVSLSWVRIGEAARENVGITQARALPLAEGRRQVVAEIRNFGSQPVERSVRLRAGDIAQAQQVKLNPGQTATAVFVIEDDASARAELLIEPDAYPADDRFHLWLGPPPALRILAIAPLSAEPEKAEELFFLSRALQTRTENQWLHFNVESTEPATLQPRQLENAHAVLLLGAGPYLTPAQWSLIREYVNEGGNLLVTPGNAPARQATLLSENGLFPIAFEGTTGTERLRRPHGIDWLAPQSPLAQLFRDEAARALGHVAVYRYTRLRATEPGSTELMRTGSGDALLLERVVGSGRVHVTAFPFLTSWTDLPLTTVFLPMIRELVAGDVPADYGIVYADAGTHTSSLAARLGVGADHSGLARINTNLPGLHMIGGTPLILNVARSESVTATADAIALQAAVTPTASSPVAGALADVSDNRISLWPWLALAALLLFILEMPIAARIRRTATPATPSAAPQPREPANVS